MRWSDRVHEQVMPAIKNAGIHVVAKDRAIRHIGYNDAGQVSWKKKRDVLILAAELEDNPDDPVVLFNLAISTNDARAALDLLRRSLLYASPELLITRKTHALIAEYHCELGEPEPALSACRAGLALDPNHPELLFQQGAALSGMTHSTG